MTAQVFWCSAQPTEASAVQVLLALVGPLTAESCACFPLSVLEAAVRSEAQQLPPSC